MSTKIRAGIVGLGDIARVHASLFKAHNDFALLGGADINADARTAFGKEFDTPTYEKVEDLLAAGADVVAICVPNAFHAALTEAVLKYGALALCEKPPALNAVEARGMADAAGRHLARLRRKFPRATGNLLYGMVYRHTLLQELPFVSADELGEVSVAFATWERARGVPARGLFTNLAASGGGAGIDLGVHILDLAWWLLGCPEPLWVGGLTSGELAQSTQVHGYGKYDPANVEVEDTAAGAIRFKDTMLFLSAAFAGNVPGGVEERVRVALRGTRSGIELSPHTGDRDPRELLPRVATERYGVLQDTTITTPLPLTVQQGYERQIQHVADVLEGRCDPIVTPEQGVTIMRMIDGLYRSAETKLPVVLRS